MQTDIPLDDTQLGRFTRLYCKTHQIPIEHFEKFLDDLKADAQLGRIIRNYCKAKHIVVENFEQVIDDSKVIPMLRGKGVEFAAKNAIQFVLEKYSPGIWIVEKKNLNPQPNSPDEDITITHKDYPNYPIIVEAKSGALRTLTTGIKAKLARKKNIPHYTVKCHRSRINHTLAQEQAEERKLRKTSLQPEEMVLEVSQKGKIGKKKQTEHGDRYTVDDFDLVVANPLNAIFKDVKYTALVDDPKLTEILNSYYNVVNREALLDALDADWRFAESRDLLDDSGFVQSYPVVWLENDPYWKSIKNLPTVLEEILVRKRSGLQPGHKIKLKTQGPPTEAD